MPNDLNTTYPSSAESFNPRNIDIFHDLGSIGASGEPDVDATAKAYTLACEEVAWTLERLALWHDGVNSVGNSFQINLLKVPAGTTIATAVAAMATYSIATELNITSTSAEERKQFTFDTDLVARQFAAGDRLVLVIDSIDDISGTVSYDTSEIDAVVVRGLGRTWLP